MDTLKSGSASPGAKYRGAVVEVGRTVLNGRSAWRMSWHALKLCGYRCLARCPRVSRRKKETCILPLQRDCWCRLHPWIHPHLGMARPWFETWAYLFNRCFFGLVDYVPSWISRLQGAPCRILQLNLGKLPHEDERTCNRRRRMTSIYPR